MEGNIKSWVSCAKHCPFTCKIEDYIISSNILAFGDETASRAHIIHVYSNFPKDKHGLTERVVSNKDKQNYTGIGILVSDGVFDCLNASKGTIENNGTIAIMRDIRD